MFWKIFSLAGIQSPWEQTGHPVLVPPAAMLTQGDRCVTTKTQLGSDLFWEFHMAKPWVLPYSHSEIWMAPF